MKTTKLKKYAPEARRDFIEAVTDKAAFYGFTADDIEPMSEEGDVAMIGGRPFSKAVGAKRKKLEARIKKQGFEQTMEAMAYTWFNRLVAIRYMELHEYLDHGYRVLSHPEGHNLPEIVEHAEHVDFPGLDSRQVVELKLDGTKEEELYRMLLIAQCNALHKAMPFLFESIYDDTELLLPDNLLHSDSLIRNLVNQIDEDDWQEVEVIGWLYQFYISEKKDEVIGKVVKSEDIPAATQLFTPNWIVKYLVQNSLGRQWMATYPNSPLKGQMEYYIEPVEQSVVIQAKLGEITPESLNPEELTILDPACGSGHILVEAYDLLKAIYQERGYRTKDIPRLILEKNLYGLEIDDRAAQLAAFAITMKARADDRSILQRVVHPQVLSIQESGGLDAQEISEALNQPLKTGDSERISESDIARLLELFEEAKTVGSLLRVPDALAQQLPTISQRVQSVLTQGAMFESAAVSKLSPFVEQARLLTMTYDAVVANPPYMGRRNGMNSTLKGHCRNAYPNSNADMFAMFIERGLELTAPSKFTAMITMQSWMFLSTYQSLREALLSSHTIMSLAHLDNNVMGIAFGTSATIWNRCHLEDYAGSFSRITLDDLGADDRPDIGRLRNGSPAHMTSSELQRISGSPIAYWSTPQIRLAFERGSSFKEFASPRSGLGTTDNDRFLRLWHEVDWRQVMRGAENREAARRSGKKWFPYNKGGTFKKWYGNNEYIINWHNDGAEIKEALKGKNPNVARSETYYFKPSVTWTDISSSNKFGVRISDEGFIFDTSGSSAFPPAEYRSLTAGFLCSIVAYRCLTLLNPTMHFQVGNIGDLPVLFSDNSSLNEAVIRLVAEALQLAKEDWDSFENAWDFRGLPLNENGSSFNTVSSYMDEWVSAQSVRIARMKDIEELNNQLFINAYGLGDELSPIVSDGEITLYRPDLVEDIQRLISYSIGCMMGRYSLDEPGLIYAHSGNEGFDPSRHKMFSADEDGIIPLAEFSWFEDDAAHRFDKFIAAAWPAEYLQENLTFVAESLGPKKGETARDTIRRYLATGFYKHHLKLYKKRPIYWLFTSGKQRGFQALVYLHRYNEGTLARMRTEYVIPLLGKMAARIDQLTDDIAGATSTPHQKRMEKEKATLTKQLAEVQSFDEKLRHYADQRISLDLDDGVKVNYGKFGDLLAEVKTITGKKATV